MNDRTRKPPAGLRVLIGATALTAALQAAATSPGEDAPQPVRDAWIDGRLETTYALNPHLNPLHIDTRVKNGVVTLSGTLESDIDRDLAVQIAKGIEGVSEVNDELSVEPGARAADAAAAAKGERPFPQWIKDAPSTARVKSTLLANGNTKGLAIDVDTNNDVVTLKGSVASREEKMLAEMIARNTSGITSVHNQLVVDGQS